MKFYQVKINDEIKGPFSIDVLMEMKSAKIISDITLVYEEDTSTWAKFSDIIAQKNHHSQTDNQQHSPHQKVIKKPRKSRTKIAIILLLVLSIIVVIIKIQIKNSTFKNSPTQITTIDDIVNNKYDNHVNKKEILDGVRVLEKIHPDMSPEELVNTYEKLLDSIK